MATILPKKSLPKQMMKAMADIYRVEYQAFFHNQGMGY
jgi:hypothetical protein